MSIEFEHGGNLFKVDTPEEAAALLALLDRREAAALRRSQYAKALARLPVFARSSAAAEEYRSPWTPDAFALFVGRLGKQQTSALEALLLHRSLTDHKLRTVLQVKNNQALAGILSGISKQAIAVNIPPRAIFRFENSRSGGKRSSRYEIADEFAQIAREIGWPTVLEQFQDNS
jgi:hypothetical protein